MWIFPLKFGSHLSGMYVLLFAGVQTGSCGDEAAVDEYSGSLVWHSCKQKKKKLQAFV